MPLYYVIKTRENPIDRTLPAKFYLTVKSLPAVDRKTFIEDMVRNTSLTKNEATTALDYLFESLPRYIALGHTVKLGELGFFKATLKSEGKENIKDATTDLVKRKKIHFVFGKGIREKVNNLTLEKYQG